MDCVGHYSYSDIIKIGIVEKPPVIKVNPSSGLNINSAEMSLELYGDSVSKGDIIFLFEKSQAKVVSSSPLSRNLVLSYDNYNRFKKGAKEFIEGRDIDKIKDLPNNSDTDVSPRNRRNSSCFFCGSSDKEEYSHLRAKETTLVRKNERSYESREVLKILSFHLDCLKAFVETNFDDSPILKDIMGKKI